MDESNRPAGSLNKDELAEVLERKSIEEYVLCLYIANLGDKSIEAIKNIKKICDENLEGRYRLDVVDIHQQPALAREIQIIATPTLIKESPKPLRRLVGNMSNTKRVLTGLDLCPTVD